MYSYFSKMGSRSIYLWDISVVMGQTSPPFISVNDLRLRCPDIAAAYSRLDLVELEDLLKKLQAGEVITPPPRRKRNCLARKCKLSEDTIKALRNEGKSLGEIATQAGVSRERIRQILSALTQGIQSFQVKTIE
jgi:hypothetical protein